MSLISRIGIHLLGVIVLAWLGGVLVHADATRDTLQSMLRRQNVDEAGAMALWLSRHQGDPALIDRSLAAQFETGRYRRLRMAVDDGTTLFQREAPRGPIDVPPWFERLLPMESAAGAAPVPLGLQASGRIEVEVDDDVARRQLWRAVLDGAAALLVPGVLAALAGALILGRLRRPLERAVEQARSLERGDFVIVAEPGAPELRRLVRAMNSMVSRLQQVFEGQASQVETLRRQATCDALTGLSNRAHFLGQLDAMLQREDGSAESGLVLLRIVDLAELNRSIGHAATDRLIETVAQALQAYTARVSGCFVGRLNGADFAMCLPAGGVAEETARAVALALQALLPAFGRQAAVAAGAVEARRGMSLAGLMSQADLALAQAEALGPFQVATVGDAGQALARMGEGGWRRRLHEALGAGRLTLVEYPVRGRGGQLMHLDCPLRVQLDPEGPPEPAARWLPLAARARLTAAFDERALALALAAIALDGQPRAVNLAAASLADSGFAARLRAQLVRAPREARQVWLEVPEAAAAHRVDLVRELGRQLRPTGVRLGLEHAGERIGRIERLFELGLDYVKLDGAITRDVSRDSHRAGFVAGLSALLHSLSVQVIAEGVSRQADAEALWRCGVDAQTGPWVSARGD